MGNIPNYVLSYSWVGEGWGDQEEWEKVQEKEDHHLLTQHFDLEDEKSPQKRNYS